ncbi:pentatricopeptide repeat-containing protein At2g44880-like [Papaver somniferum]|uniref:pentatricopeptide repeat-containing protein At2g44880-like n=1 Tax=Papaver somniferum TaxID=3469 RepID=UPI000E702925|nr:pentatricopeptide repeat-containing protein At2g44880-like [Papaver somniferum]XP_026401359.1 pentatricopeptide repeat-containing protein At2g44880-like [Papaver somniferum]
MRVVEQQSLWSPTERKCLSLLQRPNTRSSILQIHGFMLINSLDSNVNLLTKFINACCSITTAGKSSYRNATILHARRVFDLRIHKHDTFLCNSMIKGYNDNDQFKESITLYKHLRNETLFVPDSYTFPFLFKSCGCYLAVKEANQLHDQVVKMGLCSDLFVSTALVDMHVRLGNLVFAEQLFDEMPQRNQVCWTTLFIGFAKSGDTNKSKELFDLMPEKDSAAYNAMIDAYVKSGDLSAAKDLFGKMPERNVVSWTTLISGCCRNGDLVTARSLFDEMPEKNLVSWNAMISGYCQNKQPNKALDLFRDMQSDSPLEPDEVTIVSILPAIADFGAIDFGSWVHEFVRRKKLDRSSNVCTALVDMYSKCGEILKAKQFFDGMSNKATTSWNAMINGFAINGFAKEALEVLNEMQSEGFKPNSVTFVAVLSACNHGGLVDEGRKWFAAMEQFGVTPRIEHYGCMIDILGRSGFLDEAEKLIEGIGTEVNGIILSSFMFACSCHGDVFKAEKVMKKAFELEPLNDGNYVMMRNLYAGERRWRDVEDMKVLMRKNKAKKEAGCSVVEINNRVWEFASGDRMHSQWELVHRVLGQLGMHM